jgi:hypothetical protein
MELGEAAVVGVDEGSDQFEGTDDEFDAWLLEDDRTPEEEAALEMDDVHAQLFMNSNDLSQLKEGETYQGATTQSLAAWYNSLGGERRQYVDEQRQAVTRERVHEELTRTELSRTAPELLEGRLPADMERLLGADYVLGSNQSGCYDLPEAIAYLRQQHGVNVTGYNLSQRFQLFDRYDRLFAEHAVLRGYYGEAGGGKFIMVAPLTPEMAADPNRETLAQEMDILAINGSLPADFDISFGGGQVAVNAKYIAGFIDANGAFHRNANFMHDEEARLMAQNPDQPAADWL